MDAGRAAAVHGRSGHEADRLFLSGEQEPVKTFATGVLERCRDPNGVAPFITEESVCGRTA